MSASTSMPKKNMSGYILFCSDNRAAVKEELAATADPEVGVKAQEVIKALAAKWRDTADEDKKVYIDRAAEDKIRYQKEMEAFTAAAATAAAAVEAAPAPSEPVAKVKKPKKKAAAK
jgi:hypothetical protein